MNKTIKGIRDFFDKYIIKNVPLLLALTYACIMFYYVQILKAEVADKDKEILTMTQEHAENLQELQKTLSVNKGNAEVIQKEIIYAQHGLRQPESVSKVALSAGGNVVQEVQEKLSERTTELPEGAYETTDKTVVVEQPENKEVPVGIYKINTYRNWELGVGLGVHDSDKYVPISLQRNYDKCHSVAIEAHYDLEDHKVNGGELQWKVHF